MTSDRHRTQMQNLEDTWDKMYSVIKNVVRISTFTSNLAAKERIDEV
jgi:hypothetical protein